MSSMPASSDPVGHLACGHVCLDFDVDRHRYRDSLNRFLTEHEAEFGVHQVEDPAQAYIERVWPDGLPGSFIITNVSWQQRHRLLLRPDTEGPVAASCAARGLVPAFYVHLWQGRLLVDGWVPVAHVPPRAHEARGSGIIHITPTGVLMSPEDVAALEALPCPRRTTEKHLAEWREFLEWLDRLLQIKQVSLPYTGFERTNDGTLRFRIRGRHRLQALQRRFAQSTVLAAPSDASQSTDTWNPYPQKRPAFVSIGRFVSVTLADGTARASVGDRDSKNHREEEGPMAVVVNVALDDDAHLNTDMIPETGFILSSIAGDMRPIIQQSRAIARLLGDEGASPYLADWLFDIRNAATPPGLPESVIGLEDLSRLNAEQKAAVAKALVAVDVALIQGPPGTGKTTVIAAIIRLLVRAGYRVLLVSQTNLAVDNALSGLADHIDIRPLRVARADRVEDGFQDYLEPNVVGLWIARIRQDCQRRHRDREAVFLQIRLADEGFRALQHLIEQAKTVQVELADLSKRRDDLDGRRQAHIEETRPIQGQVEALERQGRAALDTAAWIENPNHDHLCPEVLAETSVAASFSRAAGDLAKTLKAGRWPLNWLPKTASRSMEFNTGLIQIALDASRAAAELEPVVIEALGLCEAGSGVGISEDTRRLRELETEKAGLTDSDREEDALRVAAINRQIKALRQDRWSLLCRSMGRLLWTLFHGHCPEEPDAMIASLQPEPKWQTVLEALRGFAGWLTTSVDETLTHHRPKLREEAEQLAVRLQADAEVLRERRDRLQQEMEQLDNQIEHARQQMEDADSQQRAMQERWAELWPQVCVDLGSDAPAPPPLDGEALAARQEAFRKWQQEHACEQRRQHRMQRVLQDWIDRLAKPAAAQHTTIQAQYVRHANPIGMTCFEAGRRDTYDRPDFQPFDVVIIDEVSKATPVELLMAMLLARTVILVGDHRQLFPMFRENEATYEDAIEEGLVRLDDFRRYTSFVTSSLFRELFEAASESLRQWLLVQYRSHPQIQAASNYFYDGQLLAGPDEQTLDRKRQHHLRIRDHRGGWLLEPHQHLLWIDSSCNTRGRLEQEQQRGSSKVNLLEADLVVATLRRLNEALRDRGYGPSREIVAGGGEARPLRAWVEQCMEHGPIETVHDLFARGQIRLNGRVGAPDDVVRAGDRIHVDARKPVGVITFYGAQVREIRQRIARAQAGNANAFCAMDLRSNTVDRFQGMERAIVLVSLVRARPYLRGGAHVRQYERINVATSRAQELLIIIGAERTFRDLAVELPPLEGGPPRQVFVYREVFELVRRLGGRRYANQLLS